MHRAWERTVTAWGDDERNGTEGTGNGDGDGALPMPHPLPHPR